MDDNLLSQAGETNVRSKLDCGGTICTTCIHLLEESQRKVVLTQETSFNPGGHEKASNISDVDIVPLLREDSACS
jgi:ferredoxin